MDKNSNTYVLIFATAVCVVLASGLAATYNGLKERISKNALFDKQRNVLIASGLYDPVAEQMTQEQLEQKFAAQVEVVVLDFVEEDVEKRVKVRHEEETVVVREITSATKTDIGISDLPRVQREDRSRILGELYIATDDEGKTVYCMPISGYGLWSTLYGFLALEEDRDTVRGITFYKHGETPGLGGEVEKSWWQDDWKAKRTHDSEGNLVGITVLKGRGNTRDDHQVDGISGATITSNGVTNFVKTDLQKYEVYFRNL